MLRMFLTMSILLRNFDEVEKIGEKCYEFKLDNSSVYVVWGSEIGLEGVSENLLKDFGSVYVVDTYGNIKRMDISSVKLFESPVYITKDENMIKALG
jgi:hypothetical protein